MKKKGAFAAYAESWRVIYETLGPEVAGPRPVLAKRPRAVGADSWLRHMPPAAPLFTGPAPERAEHREARQRAARVDRLLKKHGIGKRTGPIGWRI
ncbi:MAG TPA: hypothetical protein VFT35_08800 [Gaiellaceae bacterium]|jgi:hypothetical protein|nr:hypothetical protein [Gaiellaceae bacterium]